MTDKELQARKRLLKKLTALRRTLRKDERDILDRLVTGSSDDEVVGHSAEGALGAYGALGALTAEGAYSAFAAEAGWS